MRRKDREMVGDFGLKIIDQAEYGVLSMISTDGEPYGVPLSIVRDGNHLYFHSAKDGRKVKALAKNPKVSITFVGDVKVPEIFTKKELDKISTDESKTAVLISKVFTTEFASAIVTGTVKLVEREEEWIRGMKLICEKYAPSKMDYFSVAIMAGLNRTNVYSLEIEAIKAKRKKYDNFGEEMKWGRME